MYADRVYAICTSTADNSLFSYLIFEKFTAVVAQAREQEEEKTHCRKHGGHGTRFIIGKTAVVKCEMHVQGATTFTPRENTERIHTKLVSHNIMDIHVGVP